MHFKYPSEAQRMRSCKLRRKITNALTAIIWPVDQISRASCFSVCLCALQRSTFRFGVHATAENNSVVGLRRETLACPDGDPSGFPCSAEVQRSSVSDTPRSADRAQIAAVCNIGARRHILHNAEIGAEQSCGDNCF